MKPAILQMVDSLAIGGAERVAVNLANLLPRDRFRSFLCSTREEGPLSDAVEPHVNRYYAERRGRFDLAAILRLSHYLKDNGIELLHAHGSSVFIARVLAMLPPHPAVIWHDHYGRCRFDDRQTWLYRAVTHGIGGVIAVNEQLAGWACSQLHVPGYRVFYIPNLVSIPGPVTPAAGLPGEQGSRIVCVANFRPQKDHDNVLRAMQLLVAKAPRAHLLLIGEAPDVGYRDCILGRIQSSGLISNVTWLGPRQDVPSVLAACDVGVLGSASEGLPLSLLEYGAAGLPAVATNVGQCAEVLAQGRVGILVEPCDPQSLSNALLDLIEHPCLRLQLGALFLAHVRGQYSPEMVIRRVCAVYETLLESTCVC